MTTHSHRSLSRSRAETGWNNNKEYVVASNKEQSIVWTSDWVLLLNDTFSSLHSKKFKAHCKLTRSVKGKGGMEVYIKYMRKIIYKDNGTSC